MELNEQMTKLWIKDQISKINKKEDMGFIPSDIANAKIEILRDFYETFNLDQVTTKVIYHAKV